MRKLLGLAFAVLALVACEKDSFLRLEINDASTTLLPDFNRQQRFYSPDDTVNLELITDERYFDTRNFSAGAGSTGSFDKLELERRKVIVGRDTPYVRITYLLETQYNEATATSSMDELELKLDNKSGNDSMSFRLRYLDSLQCISTSCAFTDTLVLDSVNYYNVYYLAADSTQPALYINQDQGVVGFRTSENIFYQRIK